MRETELLAFTRQLHVLLQAGLPLLTGLELMAQGRPPKATQRLLRGLRRHIMAGRALHAALRAQPHMPAPYVHTVAAGEASGSLPLVLHRLIEQLESRLALQRQLRSALTYPAVVLLITAVVVSVMVVWVIPAFEAMFTALGAELPLATRWVLSVSRGVSASWPQGLLVLCAGGLIALGMWRHPDGQRRALDLLWRMPGWGPLHRQACQARWARTLVTLSAAGLPLTEALTRVEGTCGHPRFDAATRDIRRALSGGRSLTQALVRYGPERARRRDPELFSGMMLQMTHIGEESGSLDHLLERAAQQLELDVAQQVAALSRLIEPCLMVMLGGVVGGLVVALYLPLFQLGQAL